MGASSYLSKKNLRVTDIQRSPSKQAYDASKALVYALTPNRTDAALSTGELAAAGFLSAVPTTIVTAPVERAKVLLQVNSSPKRPYCI